MCKYLIFAIFLTGCCTPNYPDYVHLVDKIPCDSYFECYGITDVWGEIYIKKRTFLEKVLNPWHSDCSILEHELGHRAQVFNAEQFTERFE